MKTNEKTHDLCGKPNGITTECVGRRTARKIRSTMPVIKRNKPKKEAKNEMTPETKNIVQTAEKYGITPYFARLLPLSGKVKAVRIGRTGAF